MMFPEIFCAHFSGQFMCAEFLQASFSSSHLPPPCHFFSLYFTGVPQVGPKFSPVPDGPLSYDDVMERYNKGLDWLAGLYVNTMNVIHYMHDKYNYERLQARFALLTLPLLSL